MLMWGDSIVRKAPKVSHGWYKKASEIVPLISLLLMTNSVRLERLTCNGSGSVIPLPDMCKLCRWGSSYKQGGIFLTTLDV